MDAHHRKIDLQAPADLTYLLKNINDAAQKKLDLHIPPVAAPQQGEDDAFRDSVEKLVREYVTQTLTLALPSISINGLDTSPALLQSSSSTTNGASSSSEHLPTDRDHDPSGPNTYDPSDPSYEPYDPRLASRLRTLYATLEAETTRVAGLRREAPAKAAQAYVERLNTEMAAREKEVETLRAGILDKEKDKGVKESGGLLLEGVELERAGRVRETWESAVEGLERLRGVTEAVALLERASRAVKEVEGS